MTPVNRWKLVSVVLAGCLSYSWWGGNATSSTATPAQTSRLKGPVRVSAAALGISGDELIRKLFEAKDIVEIRELAEKLGMIGNDRMIDDVMPLVHDKREGVPDAIIGAFGVIATEHAVDVLIELAADKRPHVRSSAVAALGETKNRRAEPVVIELAEKTGDPGQASAMYALGMLGTDKAIAVLAKLAALPHEDAGSAMRALADSDNPAARAAIMRLIDSPSVAVAASAIDAIQDKDIDADLVTKLSALTRSTADRTLVVPALSALARAGEAGIPALRDAAFTGSPDVRVSAINVLATVESPQRIEVLREIVENEEGRIAEAAAAALSSIDSDEAREMLISLALSERASTTRALEHLMNQSGADVEQALLVIAKSESGERWDAIEHLVRTGNVEATELAIAQAKSGPTQVEALEALAGANTQPAIDTLIGIVRGGGAQKKKALELLGNTRPEDPVVVAILRDAVQSTNKEDAATAAAVLGRVGTEDARDVLVAALHSGDLGVVTNAASSLSKFRLTDEVTAALKQAAIDHPELRQQVMSQLMTAGSPLGLELVKQVLAAPQSPHEAYRAISALENAGTPAAVDVLATATRSLDVQVRAEAVGALAYTGDKRATDFVVQAVRDNDPQVRYAATRALGHLGTPKARDTLIQLTRSTAPEDRQSAVANLRRFDDPEATRRLTELIRDPDQSIANTAIDSIAGRTEARSSLRALMLDGNAAQEQRRYAAQALADQGVEDPAIDTLLEVE